MEFIEISAKTVDEAITKACISLETVSYTHLDVYKRQLLGSTLSPIRVVKVRSISEEASSSMVTRRSTRLSGSMVVSHSCSASISPRPL